MPQKYRPGLCRIAVKCWEFLLLKFYVYLQCARFCDGHIYNTCTSWHKITHICKHTDGQYTHRTVNRMRSLRTYESNPMFLCTTHIHKSETTNEVTNHKVYLLTCLLTYSLTYLITYLLTPWCRVLLEKLIGFQLVKKFPAFHGTRRFIIALTSVRHLSLS